jgi:hypothetical protein
MRTAWLTYHRQCLQATCSARLSRSSGSTLFDVLWMREGVFDVGAEMQPAAATSGLVAQISNSSRSEYRM